MMTVGRWAVWHPASEIDTPVRASHLLGRVRARWQNHDDADRCSPALAEAGRRLEAVEVRRQRRPRTTAIRPRPPMPRKVRLAGSGTTPALAARPVSVKPV